MARSGLVSLAGCAEVPGGVPRDAACDARLGALQATLDAAVKTQHLPGATAAVDVGDCHYRIASGVSDLATKSPLRPDALFRIGSITKSFVATAILALRAEGKVSLDVPVSTYVAGVPGGEGMTVRQILNHTSGLFNYTENAAFWDEAAKAPGRAWRPEELIALAEGQEPYFAPGKGWHYSNTNYIVAGLIAERVDGRPLAEILRARVLDPAGLTHTYLDGGGPSRPGLVRGYANEGGALVDVTSEVDASASYAAGGLVSNAEDLNSFYAQLLGGEILGPAELGEMETWVDTRMPGAPGYGLGLLESETPLGTALGHGGGLWGFLSYSSRVLAADVSITVLVNAEEADLARMTDDLAAVAKPR